MSRNLVPRISLHPEMSTRAHEDLRWDVSDVEETFVTQVNWFLVKHVFWYHL